MKYVVHITEILGRNIIVDAEDPAEAEEIAENLCNNGTVDLGMADWGDRKVEYIGTPTEDAYEHLKQYDCNGEIKDKPETKHE